MRRPVHLALLTLLPHSLAWAQEAPTARWTYHFHLEQPTSSTPGGGTFDVDLVVTEPASAALNEGQILCRIHPPFELTGEEPPIPCEECSET